MKHLALIVPFLLAGACSKDAASAPAARIQIAVTGEGFSPDHIKVAKDKPVTLVFDRKTDRTCAKKVIVDTGAEKIEKDLPLNQPVEIAATFTKAGELSYACSMDMVHGTITVR